MTNTDAIAAAEADVREATSRLVRECMAVNAATALERDRWKARAGQALDACTVAAALASEVMQDSRLSPADAAGPYPAAVSLEIALARLRK
jgi:hypothetical protein